jgi:agmatine deiminase
VKQTPTKPDANTPKSLGFAMPAEWERHSATWMAWPCDDQLWFGQLAAVRQEFAALITAIAQDERLELLVRDTEAEQSARALLGNINLRYHHCPYNDIWLRDSGPIFLKRHGNTGESGEMIAINWIFNGWGNKFDSQLDNDIPNYIAKALGVGFAQPGLVMEGGGLEVNGAGTLLTTRQCLLSPQRNPQLSESQIESALRQYLGIEQILWLDEGMENDHTDGHIDTITRFVDATTIVTVTCQDPSDANCAITQANLERLHSFRQPNGQPWRIIELPLPQNHLELDGDRLPPTYANFYISNNQVLVPTYNDPHDVLALELLRPLFADRSVRGLSARAIINGGGAFHCITQQQPVGRLVELP